MLDKIKTYGLIAAAAIILCLSAYTGLQSRELQKSRQETTRLATNQVALLTDLETERNLAGRLQASVNSLCLRAEELEALLPAYEEKLRTMRIRVQEAEHIAQVQTQLAASVEARRDTVFQYVERPADGVMRYTYSDPWLTAAVTVATPDSLATFDIAARDSLTLVAHKERRRCIFRKPRILRYTVESASPYTTITGLQYVEVVEK